MEEGLPGLRLACLFNWFTISHWPCCRHFNSFGPQWKEGDLVYHAAGGIHNHNKFEQASGARARLGAAVQCGMGGCRREVGDGGHATGGV